MGTGTWRQGPATRQAWELGWELEWGGSDWRDTAGDEGICHPSTVSGHAAVGHCQGETMDETVGKVAAVDTAVKAIGLTRGGRLVGDELPRVWEWRATVQRVFILKVAMDRVQVVGPGTTSGVRVEIFNGLSGEGNQDADPVGTADIDGNEELVKVKQVATWWSHPSGPTAHIGVVVAASRGRLGVELLGE